MELIESIKKDKAYIKYKLIVKNWEKEFKTSHSRTPSKFDIKEAPSKIKYAYKKYFQLKSSALENSLSICIDDEPFGSPSHTQDFDNAFEALSPPTAQLVATLPSGPQLEKLLLNAPSSKNESLKNVQPQSPFTDNLSKKLFQNKKFTLRNPRKLSVHKSQSIIENKTDKNSETLNAEHLPAAAKSLSIDLSNHCDSFSVSDSKSLCINNNTLPKSLGNAQNSMIIPSVRHLDQAWLERATGLKLTDLADETTTLVSPKTFGLSNIVIPRVDSDEDKFCDYVENSESEGEDNSFSKLKPALKKRKVDTSIKQGVVIDNSKDKPRTDPLKTHEMELGETQISELPAKKKKTSKKVKKSANILDNDTEHQPPDIAEYVPFGIENFKPRHSKPTDILKSVDNSLNSDYKSTEARANGNLENKIKNGTLNENFVKINIEKKVFVRGKKSMNFTKYKRQQNKDKKALHASMEFPESGKILCFKCNLPGHMARYCTAHRGDALLPLESYSEDNIPTLEDIQNIVSKETNRLSLPEQLSTSVFEASAIPESFLKLLADNPTSDTGEIKPIYSSLTEETTSILQEALEMFGHTSFRPGQEHAIKRILCGMSTLLILSTGGGKSLCYQLPAYIYSKQYKCITLVISPLVSLMEDQVLSMPEFLKAGCLHTNQPPTQRSKIIQCLKDGQINILLISPEALISSDSSNAFAGLFRSLPPIAFACIDEAHCVSQWSHNFRPSYLMICRVLREKLKVKCILGLTATASQSTIKSVISHINIPDGLTGVITNPALPDNLYLSVSFEKDKDMALVTYLTSERIKSFNSIIVYCIRRDECERVAAVLRSCLQEPGKISMEAQTKKRKRMSYIAEAYHAGMSGAQRKKIQKQFMDGTLRIIVATVAFGMGINKSDIRCIIHYNMPSSFESYVQEVGRAGRDGETAYCHVFMSSSSSDKNELLKHIHANTIDRSTVRKLLQRVLIPCECTKSNDEKIQLLPKQRCKGHEVGIPIDNTVEDLDLPSENIATLLCYVELHPKKYIKVLNNAYTECKIASYGGPHKIVEAAKTCPPLAMAALIESKKGSDIAKITVLEFDVIEVAAAIGWESGITKYHLKKLEWTTEGGSSKRSQLKVEFNTLGFRVKALGDLTPTELDSLLDDLHGMVMTQEKAMLYQLEESHAAFSKFGSNSLENSELSQGVLISKSDDLKSTIRDYFQRDNTFANNIVCQERPLDEERVISDVRALIASYKDCSFNGRSIARIFQGISSPNFPAIVWGRCKFWRSHIHEDFYGIIKLATQQLIQMKNI